ncbi:hepatitis A virus cellular receptor 1 homolog isoform X2 [Hyla sarda]|uniref:hepatitis A virus cellular receptor 1 homolog isoform X2 n=1 Tax=Hyla sarda TaxID=327740 RepID=UPI0024C3A586|nr:hepatitis A virus cellular receptor 1 homolog isoform X2 [Hyla sarda]
MGFSPAPHYIKGRPLQFTLFSYHLLLSTATTRDLSASDQRLEDHKSYSHSCLVAPAVVVTGRLNGRVTLPCTYSNTATTMCWGLGRCPDNKCNDEIIWTDGHKVTWRKSDRYQLLGNIGQGDVSLTITRATKKDEGTYCCRVEIPGWFNDLKVEHTVQITEAASTIPSAPTTQSFTTIYDLDPSYISPKATSADPALTTPRTESQNIETEKNEDNKLPHIIASVVILSIALISAAALIFRYRHCIRKTKDSTRCLPIISLEGLERTEDQTEQNIYTIS